MAFLRLERDHGFGMLVFMCLLLPESGNLSLIYQD